MLRSARTMFALAAMAASVAAAAPLPASAAEQDGILKLLPADPLLVIRATKTGASWDQLKASGLTKRLETAPQNVKDGLQQLQAQIARFEANAGVAIEQTLKDILGHDCALAVYGEDEEALFVTTNPDIQTLKNATEAFLNIERGEGKIQKEGVETYNGVEIHSNEVIKPDQPNRPAEKRCYCIVGNALIVSSRQDMVKAAIDVSQKKAPSAAESKEMAEAFKSMDPASIVKVYGDIDGFGRFIDKETADAPIPPQAVILREQGLGILGAGRYYTGTLTPRESLLEWKDTFLFDEESEALPPELKALFPSQDAKLDIMQLAPDEAAMAAAFQLKKTAFWEFIISTISKVDPQAAERVTQATQKVGAVMGGVSFDQFLGQIGDQNAVFLTCSDQPDAVPALSIVSELKEGSTIPTSLRTLIGAAIAGIQIQAEQTGRPAPAALVQTEYKGVQLTVVQVKVPRFQGKLNPTLFVLDHKMVLTTNTDAAKAIVDRHTGGPKIIDLPPHQGTVMGVVQFDSGKVADMMVRYKAFLTRDAERQGKTPEQAQAEIEAAAFVLRMLGTGTGCVTHSPGRIERVIELKPSIEQ